jgi:hypothetical protein
MQAKNYLKSLFLTLIIAILSSCGSGSSSTDSSSGVSGLAQKGPFVEGSLVTAYQLVNGVRASTTTTTISNDLGAYNLSSLPWSGATEIEIVGKYLDENTGTNTAAVGTLTSVIDVASSGATTANINVLTNLATEKAKALLVGNKTIAQAQLEAQTAIKELFGLDSGVDIEKLSLTTTGDNAAANTEILRISAAIAASPTILVSLTEDIKNGGDIRGGAAFLGLKTELTTIDTNFATITANIGKLDGVDVDKLPKLTDKITTAAPVITFSTATIITNEDTVSNQTLTATDIDNGDTITYGAESSDESKATVSISGADLTITPVANANGTLTIVISASDGKFKTYSSFQLTITAVNDKPVVTANQSFSIAENSNTGSTVGTVVATDTENDSLGTWAITSGNSAGRFAISNAGVITTADSLDTETTPTYTLGITVNDGTDTSDAVNVAITVSNVNEAPALSQPSNINTTYGTGASTISLSATDVDSSSLNYSVNSSSDSIATASVSGSDLTITPKAFGTATITIGVSDGTLTDSKTLTFFVAKKDLTITANDKSKAYNEDNPTLDYSAPSLVSGDTFSGALSTVATKTSSVGTYAITSTLANNNYNITYTAGTLTITKANQSAISVSAVIKDATDGDFIPTYTGGNGDGTLTATLSSTPSVATITAGGLIDVLAAGNTTITVYKKGGDNYNDSATTTFVLTVNAVNQQAQGVAVDGYLAGSDVCLDLNINNSCDQDEPTSKTGSDGSYQLTFTPEDQAKPAFKTSPILIIGGVDIGLDKTKPDNKPFVGSLKALNVLDEGSAITEINLSPATKMLADGAMKQRKANSATFAIDDLTGFISDNEAKIKKAMKIPDDKPLTIDLSLAENIDSYQQSLSIHKALETMTKSQVQSQKASATATTQTSSDAMDDMYALAFDAILDDDFSSTLEQGTFTATDLLTHIKTDNDIKDKIPAGAEKALDRASKLADTVFKAFDGFKDGGSIDTCKNE